MLKREEPKFFSVAEIDNGVYFDADYDCFGFFVTGYLYSITSYRILTDGIMIIRFAPVDQKPVQKPELSEDIVIEMPDVSEDTVMPELSEYVVIEKTFYSFGSILPNPFRDKTRLRLREKDGR